MKIDGTEFWSFKSGIYVQTVDDKRKTHARGLKNKNADGSPFDLVECIKDSDGDIVVVKHRPMKMKEAIVQHRIKDANRFFDVERTMKLSTEKKRLWQPIEVKELLHTNQKGIPIDVSSLNL